MADDHKKKGQGNRPQGQSFFRINDRGELTKTMGKPKEDPADQKTELREPNTLTPQPTPVTEAGKEPSQGTPVFEPLAEETEVRQETSQDEIEPSPSHDNLKAEQHQEPTGPQEPHFAPEVEEKDNPESTQSPLLIEPNLNETFPEWTPPENTSPEPSLTEQAEKLSQQKITGDDLATLRRYISLKEKESEDLKKQQKQFQTVLSKLKEAHHEVSQENIELQRELEASKSNEQLIKKELSQLRDKYENELSILKNDFEQQLVKSGNYQEQLQELNRQKNIWKEKISEDLKKIKLKEKELENRYELLKKDTETLLESKDQQVLELQKKADALELELETLEDRLRKENALINSIESKKRRLIETLKLAISLLEQLDADIQSDNHRKAG